MVVPRAMTGEPAVIVLGGHASLPAQRRDQRLVDVVLLKAPRAVTEEQINKLASLAVTEWRLCGAGRFPCRYRATDHWVDRLGEGGAGLVHRHFEHADGVPRQHVARPARHCDVLLLPANATDPKPDYLIAAQAGEQPDQGQSTEHRLRIESHR